MISLIAYLSPVKFRLLILQPLRDIVFFQREIQPLQNFREIEIASPKPTKTVTLPAEDTSPDSLKITLDLWIPDTPNPPVAVIFHGSSPLGRKNGLNLMFAERLRDNGWMVLTPDARGFGQSGTPYEIQNALAWRVKEDVHRIIDYAVSFPETGELLVAIGHSLGANYVMHSLVNHEDIDGIVLKGPSRYTRTDDRYPTLWRRLRFSSDRKLDEIIEPDVLQEHNTMGDIESVMQTEAFRESEVPILLLDGELEAESERKFLESISNSSPRSIQYKTIAGSGHYCGTYQIPFVSQVVFYRKRILDRCVDVKLDFINSIISNQTMKN